MDIDRIINDADAAEPKEPLVAVAGVISTLRDKGYSWRDIASFLNERGVKTDHTRVYRFHKKSELNKGKNMSYMTKKEYLDSFIDIKITPAQKRILVQHYNALNCSASFEDLSGALGYSSLDELNLKYGLLAKAIGRSAGFEFEDYEAIPGKELFLSAVGRWTGSEKGSRFAMHSELVKAIAESGFLQEN